MDTKIWEWTFWRLKKPSKRWASKWNRLRPSCLDWWDDLPEDRIGSKFTEEFYRSKSVSTTINNDCFTIDSKIRHQDIQRNRSTDKNLKIWFKVEYGTKFGEEYFQCRQFKIEHFNLEQSFHNYWRLSFHSQ